MTEFRDQLLEIVREHGYIYCDPPIRLRSGEMSHHFLDGKRALRRGRHLRLASEAFVAAAASVGAEFDAVGGLTMGADQFGHAIAVIADKEWFSVRKEPKGRGTNRMIEGADITAGMRVLVVDDVVTMGDSIQQAFRVISDAGARVVAAVTLVDRGDTAARFFAEAGVPYVPLLTYSDLGIPPVAYGRGDASATG